MRTKHAGQIGTSGSLGSSIPKISEGSSIGNPIGSNSSPQREHFSIYIHLIPFEIFPSWIIIAFISTIYKCGGGSMTTVDLCAENTLYAMSDFEEQITK